MYDVSYRAENCVTLAMTAAIVLGLFAMGAGSLCLFGFSLLLNLTVVSRTEITTRSCGCKPVVEAKEPV